MDTENVTLASESLAVLTELAYGTSGDAGKIAGVKLVSSAPVNKAFTMLGEPSYSSPYASDAAADKISKVLGNALTVEFDKRTTVFNGNTRTLKSGGAAAEPESIGIIIYETDPGTFNWLRDARNAQTPFLLTMPYGLDLNFEVSGWVHMICTITSAIEFKPATNDVSQFDVTLTGKAIAQVASPAGFPLELGAFDVMGYASPGLAVPDYVLADFQTLIDGQFKVD